MAENEGRFEWDPRKAARNLAKHGVSFGEAASVFDDRFAEFAYDQEHSSHEDRYVLRGVSDRERVLLVWYTERGERVRIIGARTMSPGERRTYERIQSQ